MRHVSTETMAWLAGAAEAGPGRYRPARELCAREDRNSLWRSGRPTPRELCARGPGQRCGPALRDLGPPRPAGDRPPRRFPSGAGGGTAACRRCRGWGAPGYRVRRHPGRSRRCPCGAGDDTQGATGPAGDAGGPSPPGRTAPSRRGSPSLDPQRPSGPHRMPDRPSGQLAPGGPGRSCGLVRPGPGSPTCTWW